MRRVKGSESRLLSRLPSDIRSRNVVDVDIKGWFVVVLFEEFVEFSHTRV